MKLYLVIQRRYGQDVVTWGMESQLRLKMNSRLEYFFANAQPGDWLPLGDNEDVLIRVKSEQLEG